MILSHESSGDTPRVHDTCELCSSQRPDLSYKYGVGVPPDYQIYWSLLRRRSCAGFRLEVILVLCKLLCILLEVWSCITTATAYSLNQIYICIFCNQKTRSIPRRLENIVHQPRSIQQEVKCDQMYDQSVNNIPTIVNGQLNFNNQQHASDNPNLKRD
jgi:hypothetical protein